ncbi:hypothetical protein D9615_005450 [Tricholomella constricta]|uniref:CCHC-type domain-containing protein n=1 Tax=Tricholomella constricta TaxID=117010 RepID=A0A8H5HED8_9AGAR|nr:hypothetical protein D9615_005450 [Tricholomella constricta]
MSTVRYNLRLRPTAVVSTGPVSDSGQSPLTESFAEVNPGSTTSLLDSAELVQAPAHATSPARSYSSVARSGIPQPRSPSPREENQETVLPSWNDITIERNRLECRSWAQCREDEQRENEARFKAAEVLKQERLRELGGRWHTVSNRRPRARSLEGPGLLTRSQADTKALWRERLNPEESKWNSIVEAAEIHEIAEAVDVGPQRAAKKPNQVPAQNTNGSSGPRRFPASAQRFVPREQARTSNSRAQETNPRPGPGGNKAEQRPKPPTHNHAHNHDNLSRQRKDELRAQNKCFKCFEVGHTARNCPDNNHVRNPGNSGPPGVANFSLEVTMDEAERLRELAETTESVETIHLGVIGIQDGSSEQETQPRQYVRRMGDPLAERAKQELTKNQPYPGDRTESADDPDERFLVYRVAGGRHLIFDHMMDYDDEIEDVLIPSAFLEDGRFDIAEWYRRQLAKRHPRTDANRQDESEQQTSRDPLAQRAEEILLSGSPYPGDTNSIEEWGSTRFEPWSSTELCPPIA